jgi:hypothetical protein
MMLQAADQKAQDPEMVAEGVWSFARVLRRLVQFLVAGHLQALFGKLDPV